MTTRSFLRTTSVVTAALFGAAGVAGRDPATPPLRSLVLSAADVPAGFAFASARSYTPEQLAAEGTWTLDQLRAWKYIGGYEAQFIKDATTAMPYQLSSNVGAYRTAVGASRSLAANAENCNTLEGWDELMPPPRVGDDAHLCTVTSTVRGYAARTYFVVWRIGRHKGSVALTGVEGSVSAGGAIALAKRQAAKMRRLLPRIVLPSRTVRNSLTTKVFHLARRSLKQSVEPLDAARNADEEACRQCRTGLDPRTEIDGPLDDLNLLHAS